MKIINIEAGVFETMLYRFEAFGGKVDALCRENRQKDWMSDWTIRMFTKF